MSKSIDKEFLIRLVKFIGPDKSKATELRDAFSDVAGLIKGDNTRRAQRFAAKLATARNAYFKAAGNNEGQGCTRYRVAELGAGKVKGGVAPVAAVAQLMAECAMGSVESSGSQPINDSELEALFGSPDSGVSAVVRTRIAVAE